MTIKNVTGPTTERIEWSRPLTPHGVDVLLVERSARRWRVFHETYTIWRNSWAVCARRGGVGHCIYDVRKKR